MLNIILIGLVSFFADFSTEMVYPMIPLYLTSVLGATPALVGVIEGIAESLASILKVFSGYITDKYRKKKPIAFFGYSTVLIYKFALLLSHSWVGILFARVIDRFGKGVRTAPRDVLVSESSDPKTLGRSFGIHKALDMGGSAAGILAAFFIMKAWSGAAVYKNLFLISMIPAVLALVMFFFIKETNKPRETKAPLNVFKNLKTLNPNLKLYLIVVFLFNLGNSSNSFLLLRAGNLGFDAASVVLLYFLYNLVSSILSIPAGKLSDRVGRKGVLVTGYLVYAIVYAAFAWAPTKGSIIAAFALYGLYTSMITGVERAFIAEIAPKELKGTMLGLDSTIVGIALLPASLIAGALWNAFGPAVTFSVGSVFALVAALILAIGLKTGPQAQPQAMNGEQPRV